MTEVASPIPNWDPYLIQSPVFPTLDQGQDTKVRSIMGAHEAGLGVNAGHDLNLQNLRDFAESVPHLAEVSIGHALIADALYLGMSNAVAQYRACLTPRA